MFITHTDVQNQKAQLEKNIFRYLCVCICFNTVIKSNHQKHHYNQENDYQHNHHHYHYEK